MTQPGGRESLDVLSYSANIISRLMSPSFRSHRQDLFLCACLDLLGLAVSLIAVAWFDGLTLEGQLGWILTCMCCYLSSSWLLGTYSVLSWRRVSGSVLLRRQAFAAFSYLLLLSFLGWLFNPAPSVWVVWRSTQIQWLPLVSVWSLLVRFGLSRHFQEPNRLQLLVVSPQHESERLMAAWRQTPRPMIPRVLPVEMLSTVSCPAILAISQVYQGSVQLETLVQDLNNNDPRKVFLTTPLAMAERYLERLPTALIPEPWMSFDDIPWNHPLGVQRQLKRFADVVISAALLLPTSPLLLLAGMLILLNDGGPIFYRQCRTGWLGQPFSLLKLRTMAVAPSPQVAPAWTVPGDQRITRVGLWLRRTRLDELPQLLQVLRGEMSLIGPRPERPEMEHELEASIPHYRKRHWMKPGLSGWAQVCAPYAASLKESELKVSYDLYYVKNFSTWLDLLILFRTIKTLLKVAGQ